MGMARENRWNQFENRVVWGGQVVTKNDVVTEAFPLTKPSLLSFRATREVDTQEDP
jgi:hypothetical protein